ncbi:MAG: lipase family protein [Lachnospiraceae bacterium]|nr:lipase family protein [Lachnospiraceae bacterium]
MKQERSRWLSALLMAVIFWIMIGMSAQTVYADEVASDTQDEDIRTVLKFRDGEIAAELNVNSFDRDSLRFHKELALLAMGLSGAAYDEDRSTLGLGEYLLTAYHSLGFEDENIWLFSYPKNALNHPEEEIFADDSLAFSIACRPLGQKLLLVMDFRGSSAQVDWDYNFLGLSETEGRSFYGENNAWPGFIEFLDGLKKGLSMYLDAHPIVKQADAAQKLVAFVVGHSLGGAAANLTGKLLNEGDAGLEHLDPSHIFVYTFAAPLVSLDVTQDANIHNVVNDNDIVPHLPLGRKHYGVDYHFSTGSSLYECHTMMTYANAVLEDRVAPIAPALEILQGAFQTLEDGKTEPETAEAAEPIAMSEIAMAEPSTDNRVTEAATETVKESENHHDFVMKAHLIGGGILILIILVLVIRSAVKNKKE